MPMPPDSAIILGADGFIGRHLARILAVRGWRVHRIGRARGDLAEPGVADTLLRAAPRAARIFHLATRQRTGATQLALQGELLAINTRMHLNVLDAWRRHQPQAKLVSTGSSCAFPESDTPLREADFQTGPLHDSVRGYGLAKQVLAMGSETYAAQYGLTWLHLFLATAYGPGDHTAHDRSHFMTGMISRALRERAAGAHAFTVWGDGGTIRDLLHVDDQIEAMLAADAAFSNERLSATANAPVTIDACARAVTAALGWNVPITYPPGTFRGTAHKTLDATRFLARTGWSPRWTLAAGIAETVRQDQGRLLAA